MGGMAMIAGTRTVLYFGRNGIGANCYGNGTSDQSLDGTIGPDGAHWCYDPTSSRQVAARLSRIAIRSGPTT